MHRDFLRPAGEIRSRAFRFRSRQSGTANGLTYRGSEQRHISMTIGRPFKPGQSGNPGGRPKSRPFKEAIDRALKASEDAGAGLSLDDIATALLLKAKSGDVAAIKELAERYDGKVPQAIMNDEESGPLKIEFSWKTEQSGS